MAVIGIFACTECGCCEGVERQFDDRSQDADRMRCTSCGCSQERPEFGLTLRLYVQGPLNLGALNQAYEVATQLGADHSIQLQRTEHDWQHFFEIPASALSARMEIERLRSVNAVNAAPARPKTRSR